MTVLADEVGDSRQRSQIIESFSRVMTEGNEEMDQDARDCARDALAKISSHEALCTERWNQKRLALESLQAAVDDLSKSMDTHIQRVPAGVIATLTGLCGWLAARAFPIH